MAEEIYQCAVNHNAEDFPKVAVDAYPMVVIGVKFVSIFVDWGLFIGSKYWGICQS
jgi:hypothetical protein